MRINTRVIDLVTVCYDTEQDEIIFRVNEQSVPIYKRRYGLIGQMLEMIGKHVQRREWPHFMSDALWTHIVPKDDIVTHEITGYKCVCRPRVNIIKREILHEAMDPGIPSYMTSPEKWQTYQ